MGRRVGNNSSMLKIAIVLLRSPISLVWLLALIYALPFFFVMRILSQVCTVVYCPPTSHLRYSFKKFYAWAAWIKDTE